MLLLSSPWKALAKNSTSLRHQSKATLPVEGLPRSQSPHFPPARRDRALGIHLPSQVLTTRVCSGWPVEHPKCLCQGVSFRQADLLLTTSTANSPEMVRPPWDPWVVLVSAVVPSTECQWASPCADGPGPNLAQGCKLNAPTRKGTRCHRGVQPAVCVSRAPVGNSSGEWIRWESCAPGGPCASLTSRPRFQPDHRTRRAARSVLVCSIFLALSLY